jgi:hypothetical protein
MQTYNFIHFSIILKKRNKNIGFLTFYRTLQALHYHDQTVALFKHFSFYAF